MGATEDTASRRPAQPGGTRLIVRRVLTLNGRSMFRAVDDHELRSALRDHAYLEGDFVLRSGRRSRYYLDKYRFETRPDLLEAIAAPIPPRRLHPGAGAVALS